MDFYPFFFFFSVINILFVILYRFTKNPLEPYKSIFHQLIDISEQMFNEYVIHEMRNENSDYLQKLKEAIDQRENERRTKVIQECLRIPKPGEKQNPFKANKRRTTRLPLVKFQSVLSSKLQNRLSRDSESFMEVIGQKLLSLAVFHYLPELRQKQSNHDRAGDFKLQTVSEQQTEKNDKFNFIDENRNKRLFFMHPLLHLFICYLSLS